MSDSNLRKVVSVVDGPVRIRAYSVTLSCGHSFIIEGATPPLAPAFNCMICADPHNGGAIRSSWLKLTRERGLRVRVMARCHRCDGTGKVADESCSLCGSFGETGWLPMDLNAQYLYGLLMEAGTTDKP